MPNTGPLPTPRDTQRLTVRFLHAPLDVEHEGDVVTMYDSARRHPGSGLRVMSLVGWLSVMWLLILVGLGAWAWPPSAGYLVGSSVFFVVFVVLAFISFTMGHLSQERWLSVDLRLGQVQLYWPDIDLARWTGDVGGLRLLVCRLRATGPVGLSTAASGYASVAVLDGTRTPPNQIRFEHDPLTRAFLRMYAATKTHKVNRHHTNRGWIVLATGEDPDLLEAELREALPTLTSVIEPQRIDDVLAGPVDAKLLRKPTPRGGA